MSRLEKIDSNFRTEAALSREDVCRYDIRKAPFQIYGLIPPEGDEGYKRMPTAVAGTVSEGVGFLHTNTAGGRVRFATDSDYIAIHAQVDRIPEFSHMPLAGVAGFDLYQLAEGREIHIKSFIPPFSVYQTKSYTSEFVAGPGGLREYTLYFPLYSGVKHLTVILPREARVLPASGYAELAPIVYYGSSITQGGCASRPGNAYEHMISRRFHIDHINLGFSGSAKGEQTMAEYIADLKMSAFVMDYDHNAPTPEYLAQTHEPFFQTVRQAQPDLPIICVTIPYPYSEAHNKRREIIRQTVENARVRGDRNVYFIDGGSFLQIYDAADGMTVDRCHPNDLGFHCMAKGIGDKLAEIWKI